MTEWFNLKDEWPTIKKAPWTVITVGVIGFLCGYGAATWYYSRQIADGESQIARYRVALGIDKASEGALVELNNEELKLKSLATASRMRELCFLLTKRTEEIDAEFRAGRIDEKARFDRLSVAFRNVSQEFSRTMRAEAINIDNEIRKRLDPKARASIIEIPPSLRTGDGTEVTFLALIGPGAKFDAGMLCRFSEAIEQMARLLPADK